MRRFFTNSPLIDYGKKFLIQRHDEGKDDLKETQALSEGFNITNILYDDLKFRTLNKKNFVIFLSGDTGVGKSTIAQYIEHYRFSFLHTPLCKHLLEAVFKKYNKYPLFDVSNICFDISDLIQRIKNSVPLETYLYDEAGSEKMVGTGSKRERDDKERVMKRVRAFQNNFIFCDPIVDESRMSALSTYKIHSTGICYETKENRSVVSIKNDDGWYSPIGNIITPYFMIKGYEEKKDKQIKDIKEFDFGGGREKYWEQKANEIVEKGIGKYLIQDWFFLIETWTKGNFTKQEIKYIMNIIRYKLARTKGKKPEAKKKVKQ